MMMIRTMMMIMMIMRMREGRPLEAEERRPKSVGTIPGSTKYVLRNDDDDDDDDEDDDDDDGDDDDGDDDEDVSLEDSVCKSGGR